MDCVKLYYKDDLVGILTYQEPQYIFVKNDKLSNNELVKYIGLNDKNEYYSNKLFTFFLMFIPQKSRIDIINKAGIEQTDSDYQILRKIASLDLNKNQFWIGL